MAKKHKHKQTTVDHRKLRREARRKTQPAKAQLSLMQPCSDGQMNLHFVALDTWFFRESRPHDAAGASELNSLFPPPVRTLAGAIRHLLGECMGFDWNLLRMDTEQGPEAVQKFQQLLGNADDLSPLSVRGAWVCNKGQRLYPVPFYLMHKEQQLMRLNIGSAVRCDLGLVSLPDYPVGRVRLPALPEGETGFKNYEQAWVTSAGWVQLLENKIPASDDILLAKDVYESEPRLGIARNNATRSVVEGQLYQTQHLRLAEDVSIEMDIMGIADELVDKLPQQQEAIVRLGGEGRMAALTIKSDYPALPVLSEKVQQHFIINFISAADFAGKLFPEGFTQQLNEAGETVWRGSFKNLGIKPDIEPDIELDIVSAVIGKVHREGGWDMQRHQPRAVKSYIPAGSAWFCYVQDSAKAKQLVKALHGQCIGAETDLGRGQILIGLWNDEQQGDNNDNR